LGDFIIKRFGKSTTGWMDEEWVQEGRYANQVGDIPLRFETGVSVLPPGACVQGVMVAFQRMGSEPGDPSGSNEHTKQWDASYSNYSGSPEGQTVFPGKEEGPYYDNETVALCARGVLLQEMKSPKQTDTRCGKAPVVDSAFSTPTMIPVLNTDSNTTAKTSVAYQPTVLPSQAILPLMASGTSSEPICGADYSKGLDLWINCGQQNNQDRRYFIKIVNRGSTPATIQALGLKMRVWVNEPKLRCFGFAGSNGDVYAADGTRLNLMQIVENPSYAQSVSIPFYQENTTHKANQYADLPLVYQSGISVIPAGGWVQGYQVQFLSGGSCPSGAENWNDFSDDYSGLPNGQTS